MTSTVCHSDIAEVHRRRLAIEQAAEDYLRATKQLSSKRLRAISQARFETARSAWQYDAGFARRILRGVRDTDPQFRPGGLAAPMTYRLAFRWLGFDIAESLAANKRQIASYLQVFH